MTKDYKDMTDAEVGVLVSTWKWRIIKAGYKNAKEFCDANGIQESHFSVWINGKQKPVAHNLEKVEKLLGVMEEEACA